MDDYNNFKEVSQIQLIGITNTSDPQSCYSERLLKAVQKYFNENNSEKKGLIGRIDAGNQKGRSLILDLGLNMNQLPAIVVFHNKDYYFYLGSFGMNQRDLVINWIERIFNPLHHILSQDDITSDQQIENFLNPQNELDGDSQFLTMTRAIAFVESNQSYLKFRNIAKELVHRHDLRIAIVQDPQIIEGFKNKFGKEHFRMENTNSIECLVVKNKAEQVVSFVNEGRMLNQKDFISKQSLAPVDVFDQFTVIPINDLEIPIFFSIIDPDLQNTVQEGRFQAFYLDDTLPYLMEAFFNELVFIVIDAQDSQNHLDLLNIQFKQIPTFGMFYQNGSYAVYPSQTTVHKKTVQQWIRKVKTGLTSLQVIPDLEIKARDIQYPQQQAQENEGQTQEEEQHFTVNNNSSNTEEKKNDL